MIFDPARFRVIDYETAKFGVGRLAPKIIAGSMSEIVSGKIQACILPDREACLRCAEEVLRSKNIWVGANTAFDLACAAAANESLLPLIFQAIRDHRVYDVLIAQALDAIAGGHLNVDPRTGSDLRKPGGGKIVKRYSLDVCVDLVLGRTNAKERDTWRTSYALLDGISVDRWPEEARQYMLDDALNELEVAVRQVTGWLRGPIDPPGVPEEDLERGPARNLGNLSAQVEAAFCLHLGAAWGLRTELSRVEKLALEVEEKHREAVRRFQKLGWIRPNGTEDQAAVKRAVALAYGASGTCSRCQGRGVVRGVKQEPCRGAKIRGRYQGCGGPVCSLCEGTKIIEKLGGESTCWARDGGCDGTKLHLSTAPMLPRTDKGGVKTDRDASMESGDEDISDYADNVFEKIRSTYVPYLRRGIDRPIHFSPNALVASGRASYDTVHQIPRKGGVRECFCARPGCVLCSTDYASGELCTLGQVCLWIVKHSRMVDIINETKDPGSLHTFLASKMLGVSFDEAIHRIAANEKQMQDFRQAAKVADFGFGGGMGSVTFVLSSRKQNSGVTKLPDGSEMAGIRYCILVGGADYCGKEKIMEWNGRDVPPVCAGCVDVVHHLIRPAFFEAYPEVKEYHDWVAERIDLGEPALCLVWNPEKGEIDVVRRRGGCGFSDMANNGFQALLADIFKKAYCEMTREAYLGVKADGSPSPLAGARFPIGLHDEPIAEILEETAHVSAPRISEIMEAAGRSLAPDVFWRAEPAIAKFWSKSMAPVYRGGKLVLWEPQAKAA